MSPRAELSPEGQPLVPDPARSGPPAREGKGPEDADRRVGPGVFSAGIGLTALSFCSAAFSALATLIVAVRVGPSAFGTQASALGLATLGALLLDSGLSTVVQRSEARSPGATRGILGRRYALCGAVLGAALLLGLLIGPLTGLTSGYAAMLATSLATGAVLRGTHRFGLAGLLAILDKGAACVAAFLLAGGAPELALVGAFLLGTTLQV